MKILFAGQPLVMPKSILLLLMAIGLSACSADNEQIHVTQKTAVTAEYTGKDDLSQPGPVNKPEVMVKNTDLIESAVEEEISDLEKKASKKYTAHSNHTIKPKPPITVDYRILGEPAIGQPLEIELIVASKLKSPVKVSYSALDDEAMKFMSATKADQSFKLAGSAESGSQKIILVPQKEGRNYFSVSSEIETEQGMMAFSRSIAIQVGDEPYAKKINGNLVLDTNNEAVISMKASER